MIQPNMFPEVVPTEDPNRRYTTAAFIEWICAKAGVAAWDVDVAADAESHWAPRWFSLQPYPGSAGVDGLAQSWLPPPEAKIDRGHGFGWRPCPTCLGSCSVPVFDDDEKFIGGKACPTCYDHQGQVCAPWCIFDNPPFDDLGAWLAKTWSTIVEANRLSIEVRCAFVLPGNRHEQPFWHEHVEPFRDGRANRFGYRLELYFPEGRQAYAKPGSRGEPIGSADFPSAVLVWRRA